MKKLSLLITVGLMAGCAAQPTQLVQPQVSESANSIPQWVLNPTAEDGLASSACVPWSGQMTVDRAQAIAAARAGLSQQIEIKASVLDRLYMRNTTSDGRSNQGGTFEQVSKQVSSQTMQGTVAREIAMTQINDQDMLCAYVVMPHTREVFDTVVEGSNRQLDPTSREALYEEFRTQKALESLERELEQLQGAN